MTKYSELHEIFMKTKVQVPEQTPPTYISEDGQYRSVYRISGNWDIFKNDRYVGTYACL